MSGTPRPLFQSAGVTRLGFFHLPQTGIVVVPFHSKSSVFVLSHLVSRATYPPLNSACAVVTRSPSQSGQPADTSVPFCGGEYMPDGEANLASLPAPTRTG